MANWKKDISGRLKDTGFDDAVKEFRDGEVTPEVCGNISTSLRKALEIFQDDANFRGMMDMYHSLEGETVEWFEQVENDDVWGEYGAEDMEEYMKNTLENFESSANWDRVWLGTGI